MSGTGPTRVRSLHYFTGTGAFLIFYKMRKMSEFDRIWQLAGVYLAAAEAVRPKHRAILLDILERYCEIELGCLPAPVRDALGRLRAKESLVN
jgi:hypothetical protein